MGNGIDSVIFTRTGLFLQMSEPVAIKAVNISKDGQKVASKSMNTTGDALINFNWNTNTKYDLEVETDKGKVNVPVYSSEKSSPVKIAEIPLEELDKGEMEYRYYACRGAVRAMGPTANDSQLPAQHPDADTLFVYDYDGNLKWKWKMGEGTWNKDCILSKDGKYMVIPIGLVPETPFANPQDMGIYVFSPEVAGGATAKLDWFYHTEGFAYKVDVSPDNNCIAVLEGPFDIDPDRMKENIVGKHRLIILS